jgi:hypothetical protein
MEYKRREGLQKEGVIEYVKYCWGTKMRAENILWLEQKNMEVTGDPAKVILVKWKENPGQKGLKE